MSEFRVILSAITCLSFVSYTVSGTTCANSNFTQADVNLILDRANEARIKVRKGEQKNGLFGTNLPPAKPTNNLTWHCEYEYEAANFTDYVCKDGNMINATRPNVTHIPILMYMAERHMHIAQILNTHLDEIDYKNLTRIEGLNVIYNNETDLAVFADVIRENTTKIGCGYHSCVYTHGANATVMIALCISDQEPIKKDETIYVGEEVTTTTTTTTTTSTTTTTTTTTTTMPTTTTTPASAAEFPIGASTNCPSNSGMTDQLRTQFSDMHNYRRGLLAQGQVARKNGNRYPTAANMARMNYDCGLEADALSYVRQCPSMKSGSTTVGENFYLVSTSGLSSWSDAVKKAVTSWWKVVRTSSTGVGVTAVTFRQHHVGTEVESWSQMAWARTNKLGCSIAKCFGNYVTVCRYMEKGNAAGQQVYIPGTPCSQCSSGCAGNGLCN